jgi:voltage-gated potassium channel
MQSQGTLRDELLGGADDSMDDGGILPTAASSSSSSSHPARVVTELDEFGSYSGSSRRGAGRDGNTGSRCCGQRIDCKAVLCCCVSKTRYYQVRRLTYDTLSRNASKFGYRTNYLPSRIFELYSVALVLANVLFSIWVVQSDTPFVSDPAAMAFDVASTVLFTAEWVARLWACIEDQHDHSRAHKKCGTRCRWVFKALSFFDLLCLVPFYTACGFYAFAGGYDEWVALIRVTIFLRLERQAKALDRLRRVLGSKAEELMAGVFFAVVCVLYCAVVIYYLEMAFVDPAVADNQFKTFGDAVWWTVATITSVG